MPHPCDQPCVTPPPGEPRALFVGRHAGRRWSHRLHRLCYDALSHVWDKSLLVPGFRERVDLMTAWLTRHGSPEDRTDDLLGILTCAGLGLVEALALPATVALLARKERVGTLDPGLGGSRAS